MAAQGPHPLTTRKAALRRVAKGETKAEVCRQLGIDPKTLRAWLKDAAEGKVPGARKEPPVPVDEAPAALAMPQAAGRKLDEVLALTMPVGTPQDLTKNIMAQKIARALQDSPIPQPTKVSEFKHLVGLLYDTLGITGKGAAKSPAGSLSGNLTIRMDVVARPPRSAGAPVTVDAVEVVADDGGDEEEE